MQMIGPMPQMGFGTWTRAGEACVREVQEALQAGYRHIDTAAHYNNEEFVGEAIAASGLPREQFFITTKVAPEHLGPGMVRPQVENSLRKLRLGQVDLLLVHWPSLGDRYDINEYLGQFAEVQDQGLARHIGVSNFTKRHIDAAVSLLGSARITTNQVEIHALHQNRRIVDYCKSKGIPMTAYTPLARGAVLKAPLIQSLAQKHGVTAGQISLAFLMAEGHVVIPTSSSPVRMAENFAALRVKLADDEITALRGIDEGLRLVNGSWAPKWDS